MKIGLFLLSIFSAATLFAQGNLPQSRQATFIENSGPDEVMVRAKGIGGKSGFFGFDEETSVKLAVLDAERSAVYFVVFGGEGLDGILKTNVQKQKFAMIEQSFFAADNVVKFIAWEENGFDSRIKLAGEKKILVEKEFRINRKGIINYLVDRHVIESVQAVTEQVGYPTLMVLPNVKPGQNPLQALQSDSLLQQAASVIEAFLTANRYNVVEPEQAAQLYQQEKAVLSLKGDAEDPSYMIALSVGSDIYLTYSVTVSTRYAGNTVVHRASASVQAFETTTARLLASETGYSQESAAPATALVEAAITNAMNNVLSRINAYWQEDIKNGLQYKIIFNIVGQYSNNEKYDIEDAVAKTLNQIADRTKENIVSDRTMDYSVWIDNTDLQSPLSIFLKLRKVFNNNFPEGKLEQILLNRKLIMVGIE